MPHGLLAGRRPGLQARAGKGLHLGLPLYDGMVMRTAYGAARASAWRFPIEYADGVNDAGVAMSLILDGIRTSKNGFRTSTRS